MARDYVAYVCSQTHWDREWYGTFQQFRWRLVRLMDKLLKLLQADSGYRCFNLDGQTVCLEDYLEIRPEAVEPIEQLVAARRLTVGPWYVLPDEFCVSGESLIRNLLRGHQTAQRFGGRMGAGYLPDMFGHISQMPQLLQGVGLDVALLWRGLSGEDFANELWWEAPDGARVLLEHIPEYCGYCNAAFFVGSLPPPIRGNYPHDRYLAEHPDDAVDALETIVEWAARGATSEVLLLLNGVDHMEPQERLPQVLAEANRRYEQVEFRHATLDEFVAALRAAVPDDLQTVRGELKDTVWTVESSGICLPNILSSRAYQKLHNEECQYALERIAEPLCAMATLVGSPYPAAQLRKAWEWLLKNHPHDSIGGCSVDRVHRQMETRYEWCEEIAGEAAQQALFDLTSHVSREGLADNEIAVPVFNTLNWDVTDRVEVVVDVPADWLAGQGLPTDPAGIARELRQVRLTTWDGEEVACRLISAESLTALQSFRPGGFVPPRHVVRLGLSLSVDALPAFGYRTYRLSVIRSRQMVPPAGLVVAPLVMENPHLRVEVNPNGTLDLAHKETGARYEGLHYFEDGGDNGDGYTYSPPTFDSVATTLTAAPDIALIADGPDAATFQIRYRWELPAELTPDRQRRAADTRPVEIVSRVTLGATSRRVEIETTIENTVRDHRLRAAFPSGLAADQCDAGGHFDVLRRPIEIDQPPRAVWKEDQPRQYPQQGWCGLTDKERGLAVLSRGILEFEALDRPDRPLALTLLRAVKYLGSGGDLNTIRSGAGPQIETPESQCLRSMTFRYAILPHTGDWQAGDVVRQAYQHRARFCAFVAEGGGELPPEHSFLRLEGDGLAVSALKQAEDDQGLILRFWNYGAKPTTATLTAPGLVAARPTDLLERPTGQSLDPAAGEDSIDVPPKRIATLRLRCEWGA